MNTINATTGNNPRKERKVANVLYIAIGMAIVAGLAIFFIMGRNQASLSPYKSDSVHSAAPDSTPGTQGKPGTIPDSAAPQDR
jgi:hypothetical protein